MNVLQIALKEWSATCSALAAGRQILILRKGGIADADGAFELEHSQFFLMPTFEHQHANLVKPEFRDLLQTHKQDGENSRFVIFHHYAEVARVWSIAPENAQIVERAPHMWTKEYLQIRWDFRPREPLLCVALRVWSLAQPHKLDWRTEFGGCRSWIDLRENLAVEGATPALSEAEFSCQLQVLEEVFSCSEA